MTISLIIVPIITMFLNKLIYSNSRTDVLDKRIIYLLRNLNLIISNLNFWILLGLLLTFNFNNNEFQYRFNLNEYINNFNFSFGLDGISLSLLLLMNFFDILLLVISVKEVKNLNTTQSVADFYNLLNLLLIIKFFVNLLFFTLDLFIFFLSFELILIPMFLIITRFGSQYSFFLPRLEAAYRFFFYTMIGSLLMFLSILLFYLIFGTTQNELLNLSLPNLINETSVSKIKTFIGLIWFFLFFSFLIKIPMFPFHTWLPFAHSDAPTSGSIILAAILLKLGSYGIIRYSLTLFNSFQFMNSTLKGAPAGYQVYNYFLPFIYILALLSIYICSFIALRSIFDIKKVIAYSSIVHMNFSIFGFFSEDFIGLFGSSFLMFTHAFISSALFLLVGSLYKRFHSRYLPYFKGLFNFMPLFSFFFLFFTFANISLPFCSSFLSEFFILISTFSFNPFISILLLFSLVFSTAFSIWLTNRLLFGQPTPYLIKTKTPFRGNHEMVTYYNNSLSKESITGENNPLNHKVILTEGLSVDLSANELFCLLPLFFFTIFFTFYPTPFSLLFSLPLFSIGCF